MLYKVFFSFFLLYLLVYLISVLPRLSSTLIIFLISFSFPSPHKIAGDRLVDGHLADWIVQQKLFTQYLKKQCIPFTSVKDDFNDAIKASNWELFVLNINDKKLDILDQKKKKKKTRFIFNIYSSLILSPPQKHHRPVRVYGYNGLDVLFGGDVFEAETDCNRHLGQVIYTNNRDIFIEIFGISIS